jgi:hypothetical protein
MVSSFSVWVTQSLTYCPVFGDHRKDQEHMKIGPAWQWLIETIFEQIALSLTRNEIYYGIILARDLSS